MEPQCLPCLIATAHVYLVETIRSVKMSQLSPIAATFSRRQLKQQRMGFELESLGSKLFLRSPIEKNDLDKFRFKHLFVSAQKKFCNRRLLRPVANCSKPERHKIFCEKKINSACVRACVFARKKVRASVIVTKKVRVRE